MKEICVTYGSLKYFWLSNYAKPWLSKVVKLWSWCAITKIDKHQTNKVIKINGRVKINNSYFYFLLDLTKYGVPTSKFSRHILFNIFLCLNFYILHETNIVIYFTRQKYTEEKLFFIVFGYCSPRYCLLAGIEMTELTLSWRRSLSYRNQLQSKSMD